MNFRMRYISDKSYMLNESLTDTVYHYTSVQNLLSIVESNSIILQSAFNRSENNNTKQMFYLSTTRNKAAVEGFAYQNSKYGSAVRIELDGRKLNQRYKAFPIDYWGALMGKQSYYNGSRGKDYETLQRHTDFEAEDRLVSYEPTIENIRQYIKRIDVIISPDAMGKRSEMTNIVNLALRYARSFNINFYDNPKDYNTQSENTINEELMNEENYNEHYGYKFDRSSKYNKHIDNKQIGDLIKFILYGETAPKDWVKEGVKILKQNNLDKYVNKTVIERLSDQWGNIKGIASDIMSFTHEWSKNPTEEKSTFLKLLSNYMRSHKFRSIPDALRWKDSQKYGDGGTDDGLWGDDSKKIAFYVFKQYDGDSGKIVWNPKTAKFIDYFLYDTSKESVERFCDDASQYIWDARGGWNSPETPERIRLFLVSQLKKNPSIVYIYNLLKQMCRGDEYLFNNVVGESRLTLEELTYAQARNKIPYDDTRNDKIKQLTYKFKTGS